MACDRMSEFLSLSGNRQHHGTANGTVAGSSTGLPINDETESVFSTLDGIRRLVTTLDLLHSARLIDSSNEKREAVYDAMEKIRLLCHSCCEMMITYDRKTQECERGLAKGIPSLNTAELRMRHNIASFMEHQLMTEVSSVWKMQKRHEKQLIEVTSRRLKARFPVTQSNGSNNEVSTPDTAVVGEPHIREIAQQIIATGSEGRLFFLARDELERVVRTRDAVFELERELQDLLNLFRDLYFLVNEQHDRLLRVQENVQRSNRNLDIGMKELKEAKHHQKSCCCVI